jgi:DNA-binding CsgD family transcriptional regulator
MAARLAAAGARSAALECRAESVQTSVLAGRLVEAVMRADELLEQPASIRTHQTASIFQARASAMMGDLELAARRLTDLESRVTDDFVGRGELLSAQADIAFWGGLPGRAVGFAEAVTKVPSPALGAYTLPELTRAWAQVEMRLPPQRPSGIIDAPTQAGAPLEMDGIDRYHAGDATRAAELFAQAAAAWAGHHALRELWCRWAEGEALRRAGEVERALERLDAALDAAMDRRIDVVAVRIRRSLRLAGRRIPTGRTPRASPLGLTQRERQVVDLASSGMTNVEIAGRMGLGRPTVARLLSNAMGKLGAGSRAQAVRLVAEQR